MTRVRRALVWAAAGIVTLPGWLPVIGWWLRLLYALARRWWVLTVLDRRVQTLALRVSAPRGALDTLASIPGCEDLLTTSLAGAVRDRVAAGRYRPVSDLTVEVGPSGDDFLRNRLTVGASIRVAGYPARRWLVLADRARPWAPVLRGVAAFWIGAAVGCLIVGSTRGLWFAAALTVFAAALFGWNAASRRREVRRG